MIDLIIALILAGLTSVWRFYDGTSKGDFRGRSMIHRLFLQTSTPAVLCLIAVLIANGGLLPQGVASILNLKLGVHLLAAGLVFYLLIRGMPGWERFFPFRNQEGHREQGMLLTYAAPMFVCGVLGLLVGLSAIGSVLTVLVGLAPCAVYVLGSRLEERRKDQGYVHGGAFRLPFGGYWTAEELGRLSMGALVFPLPLL